MHKDNPFDIASSIVPQHLDHPYNYHYEMMWEAAKMGAAMMKEVLSMRHKVMETGWEDKYKIPSIEDRLALLPVEVEIEEVAIELQIEALIEEVQVKEEEASPAIPVIPTIPIAKVKIKKSKARRKASFLKKMNAQPS